MKNIEDPLFAQEEIPIQNEVVHKFKIESVTGHSFEVKNGAQSPSGFKSYLLKYDDTGNKLSQQKYSNEGKTIHEWVYDSKGRLLREIAYEVSGRISFRFEYRYNYDGNWNEKQMYLSGDEPHCRIIANRDARGRIIEGVYYDASDQRIRTDSYVYDECGMLVRMSMGHMGESIYEYDEHDNLKRKTRDLPSASAFGENFVFQYDDRGLLIQRNHLYYSVTVFEYTFFV